MKKDFTTSGKLVKQYQPNGLVKFNQSIQISVEVDEIASKLYDVIKDDSPHKALIVNTIIGSLLVDNGQVKMTMLYNSLNGFTNEIDFEIGQTVNCDARTYNKNNEPIGECKIVDINIYSSEKVKVEFPYTNENHETVYGTKWVSHHSLTELPPVCI